MRRRAIGIAVATLLALGATTVFVPTMSGGRLPFLARGTEYYERVFWEELFSPRGVRYKRVWDRERQLFPGAPAGTSDFRFCFEIPAMTVYPIHWPLLIATHLAILALGSAGMWLGVVRPRRRADSGARLAS